LRYRSIRPSPIEGVVDGRRDCACWCIPWAGLWGRRSADGLEWQAGEGDKLKKEKKDKAYRARVWVTRVEQGGARGLT